MHSNALANRFQGEGGVKKEVNVDMEDLLHCAEKNIRATLAELRHSQHRTRNPGDSAAQSLCDRHPRKLSSGPANRDVGNRVVIMFAVSPGQSIWEE